MLSNREEGACTDQPKSAIFKSPWKQRQRIKSKGGREGGRDKEMEMRRKEERWIGEVLLFPVTNLEVDKQILWFDVTVDHLLRVAVVESIS